MQRMLIVASCLLTISTGVRSAPFIDLGSASSFAVLAGSVVTSTGSTVVDGDVGVWPGIAVAAVPPIALTGTAHAVHAGDATAMQAHTDLSAAYGVLAGQSGAVSLTGQNLGSLTLAPGLYSFAGTAQLTGTLTLDGGGDPSAVWLFQIGSTLITADSAEIVLAGGAEGGDVFWQVGSSATIGGSTHFAGSIMAQTSITLGTSATIASGRALAIDGAVTLDTNVVDVPAPGTPVPEPASMLLFAGGLAALATRWRSTAG